MYFLDDSVDIAGALDGRYSPFVVAVSLFVAILAAHTAILIAREIRRRPGGQRRPMGRFILCSVTTGCTVWAMHFIGMLAFELPIHVHYAALTTVLSMAPAVLTGMLVTYTVTGHSLPIHRLAALAVLVVSGIVVMHLTGMAAMIIDARMLYDPKILLIAFVVGSVLSTAALYSGFIATGRQIYAHPYWQRLIAAGAFALTVFVIHYIAMTGTYFFPNPDAEVFQGGLGTDHTFLNIGLITVLLAGLVSFTIGVGRRLESASALQREVAEREKVESALRIREAQLRAVFDNTPMYLNLKDRDGHYLLINKPYEDWLGRPADEIIGRKASEFFVNEDEARIVQEAEMRVVETGEVDEREVTVTRPDGNTYDRIIIRFPVKAPDGRVTGIGTAAFDITARKQAERGLRAAMETADYANRAKSVFLTHMSHELRTPLNSIIGFSEALLGQFVAPVEDPKILEYLENIHGSGSHLLAIVSDLLDLSKIEAGALDVADDDIAVRDVIEATVRLIDDRTRMADQKVTVEVADDFPLLRGDELRVKQVLLNLLGNAAKFTPQSGRISARAGIDDTGGIFITVEDNGVGIDEELLPRITEPFVQASMDVTSRNHEGTGLGLALVKSLAEIHGGSLEIKSTLGLGTSATIRFPAERVIAPESVPRAAE